MKTAELTQTIALVILGVTSSWAVLTKVNEVFDEVPKFFVNCRKIARSAVRFFGRIPNDVGGRHTSQILVASLLMNVLGFALARWVPSVLYLDMVGTAACAIALGPLWGMTCGAVTNLVTYALDGGDYQAYLLAFAHTNVIGGLFWGVAARGVHLHEQIAQRRAPTILRSLAVVGIIGALPIALSQFYVQFNEHTFRIHFQLTDLNQAPTAGHTLEVLQWIWVDLLRTIPDKVLAVFFGLLLLRALLPVSFERGRAALAAGHAPAAAGGGAFISIWVSILGLVSLIGTSESGAETIYDLRRHWLFWTFPVAAALVAAVFSKSDPPTQLPHESFDRVAPINHPDEGFTWVAWAFHFVVLGSFLFFLLGYVPYLSAAVGRTAFLHYLAASYAVYLVLQSVRESARQHAYASTPENKS